jgi:hypothetical protein
MSRVRKEFTIIVYLAIDVADEDTAVASENQITSELISSSLLGGTASGIDGQHAFE